MSINMALYNYYASPHDPHHNLGLAKYFFKWKLKSIKLVVLLFLVVAKRLESFKEVEFCNKSHSLPNSIRALLISIFENREIKREINICSPEECQCLLLRNKSIKCLVFSNHNCGSRDVSLLCMI